MFPKLLEALARKLDELQIPYMVIGGQAVLYYGEPRLTRDIDVTLGIGSDELPRVTELATQLNLEILASDPARFVRRTMVLPARDPGTHLRVDFIFSFSPYERQAIARAKAVKLGTAQVRFTALEDLIIHKVIAGRPQDIDDVRKIVARKPRYDDAYLRTWLAEFDKALAGSYAATFDRILSDVSFLDRSDAQMNPDEHGANNDD